MRKGGGCVTRQRENSRCAQTCVHNEKQHRGSASWSRSPLLCTVASIKCVTFSQIVHGALHLLLLLTVILLVYVSRWWRVLCRASLIPLEKQVEKPMHRQNEGSALGTGEE